MTTVKARKYRHFIGIDVSKNELDFAVMEGSILLFHEETKNTVDDINQFILRLKVIKTFALSKCLFCMENTGFYNNHLLTCLKKTDAKVVVEHPRQIQLSLGITRQKNDKVDAIRIAYYAYRFQDMLRLWVGKRSVIQLLATLFNLRVRLIEMQMAVKSPLQEQELFINKVSHKHAASLCKRTVSALEIDIEKINTFISETIKTDESLNRLVKIITSVPSIGLITALYIIITTNEFRDISDPKKFACYAGVAPFGRESGKTERRRKVSPLANKKMKSLLHTCAMSAVSHAGELRTYYKRKTEVDGKPKMLALNAVRFKLILRVFACVNQDRLYEKLYERPILSSSQLDHNAKPRVP